MSELWTALRDIGVPILAVITQAILTWQRVQDHDRRIKSLETTIRGSDDIDGLTTRVRVLEHQHGRGDA